MTLTQLKKLKIALKQSPYSRLLYTLTRLIPLFTPLNLINMQTILLVLLGIWLLYQCLSSINYSELQDEPYYFIIETPDYVYDTYTSKRGYGNGYVRISAAHPLHGKNYYDGEDSPENLFDVHGGITYSGHIRHEDEFVFGFDTAHSCDNKTNCSAEYVHQECQHLLKQIKNYKK